MDIQLKMTLFSPMNSWGYRTLYTGEMGLSKAISSKDA
jgi:hypothetical protein